MRLKFLGASGTVTGSSYLLTGSGGTQLLIDLGMFQGAKETHDLNYQKLQLDPKALSAVLLTHAHLDHCGRLPMLSPHLVSPVYMTSPTRSLAELSLFDAAKVAKEDKRNKPLFDDKQVVDILTKAQVVDYNTPFSVSEFAINYLDAGHILGSASIEITDTTTNEKIVFSGDLGNSPEDISSPTQNPKSADYVVMESTYGGRVHPKEDPREILVSEINTIENFKGTLLIPAFSLERTQVLLHILDHLKKEGKIKADTPIYLDSPMAIKATYIYASYPDLYSEELKSHTSNDDPFSFPGLVEINKHKESLEMEKTKGAKVIIAGSGMMSGGRILNHAINYLPLPTTRLLLVGYQAEGTIGRQILDGARLVRIFGKEVVINAKVREIASMSAHADEPKLLNWLGKINGIKKVILTHGEDEARQKLEQKINSNLKIDNVYKPKLYEEIEIK